MAKQKIYGYVAVCTACPVGAGGDTPWVMTDCVGHSFTTVAEAIAAVQECTREGAQGNREGCMAQAYVCRLAKAPLGKARK